MWVWFALGALAAAVAAAGIWVRMAPVDPARWHVDPVAAQRPGANGWLVGPSGAPPPLHEVGPTVLLRRLDAAARAEPRTRVIAGSVAEGRLTYETRSAFWRFPDYTTVTVLAENGAARPVLLARSRFGRSDFGVNRARIERWLAALG